MCIQSITMRKSWNGFIGLKIKRPLSKTTLGVFLIAISILFTSPLFAKERKEGMSILLVPVGGVDQKVMEFLKHGLNTVFHRQVMMGKGMSEPDYAFNKKRNQYLSTAILDAILKKEDYMAYGKVLGVVDQDLYVPELNFVFGEAGRKAAVISLTRLRQEFYNLPQDQSLFYKRVLTEAVHELGHTYGLGHCSNPHCVMFFSNTLMDTDRKGSDFCPECKGKLSTGK
jgi:archaemetzincin